MGTTRTAFVAALLAVTALPAFAQTPIAFSSRGSFSNLSSCDNSGGDRDCRIVNAGTQVQWGSQHRHNDFVNPSTLTATPLSFSGQTNLAGVTLARLDWYNSATLRLNSSLDSFDVRYTMRLDFTQPSGPDPSGHERFDLRIYNPINPTGDTVTGLTVGDLSSFDGPLNLGNVTISNLRYHVVDGAGSGTSYYNSSTQRWYNDENNFSSLFVLADISAPVSPIPEPESYAMLVAGLGLIGLMRRRRKPHGSPAA